MKEALHLRSISRGASWLVVALLVLGATPQARAQESSLDSAAARIAKSISWTKRKYVEVPRFFGPDPQFDSFGDKLASDFASALAKADPRLKVEFVQTPSPNPSEGGVSKPEPWSGEKAKAVARVRGTWTVQDNEARVEVRVHAAETGDLISVEPFFLPLPDDVKAQWTSYLVAGHGVDSAQPSDIPVSGKNGYSYPSCLSCPRANYTSDAIHDRIQGTIELAVIVDADGSVQHIDVIKGLPDGLTESAIETVRSWKLSPAKGPDGKPAAVRQVIELTFQLFR